MQGLYKTTPPCSYIREICYNDFAPAARQYPRRKTAAAPAKATVKEERTAELPADQITAHGEGKSFVIDAASPQNRQQPSDQLRFPAAGKSEGQPLGGLPLALILWWYYVNDDI